MTKTLLLFSKSSVEGRFADPERLISLVQTTGSHQAEYELLDDLLFYVSSDQAVVVGAQNKQPLSSYDVVYFRRMEGLRDLALAAAIYLKKTNTPFVDEEVYMEKASLSKLSTLFRLWEHGLPMPKTIVGISKPEDMWFFSKYLNTFPVVVKSIHGTRGSDNYVANDEAEVLDILAKNPDQKFIIQEFIPNKEDFRILVFGDEIKMIIKRSRGDSDSHKNNISLGADFEKVKISSLPETMLEDAVSAARAVGRDIAGVDLVISEKDGTHYFFEVNRAPQIDNSSFEGEKAEILSDYLGHGIEQSGESLRTVGSAEELDFPELKLQKIPARIDTGANVSAIWASSIKVEKDELSFTLFDESSKFYTGGVIRVKDYSRRIVRSSTGTKQTRYVVKILVVLNGRELLAAFTLADRSTQIYPILIGRNILKGNFVVDVRLGKPLKEEEKARQLQNEAELNNTGGNS